MEDLHHQVVLVGSRQILIIGAWTAFVNKPSCVNHALSKLIITTLYIESRYVTVFQVFIVLPLNHSLQRWNGTFFEKTTLRNVGLTIQLNHASDPCPLPVKGPADFVVFDSTGIHRVSLNFCGCRKSTRENITRRIQLLRNRWFPATSEKPKTVFTFSVLKIFHQLTLQSKVSIYDYYHTILRLTDPYELDKMTVLLNFDLGSIKYLRYICSTDILSFIGYLGFGEIYKGSNMLHEDMIPMELIQPLQESLLSNARHAPIPRRTFRKIGKMLHFTYGKLPFSFAVAEYSCHIFQISVHTFPCYGCQLQAEKQRPGDKRH